MWSYIAGGLKGLIAQKIMLWDQTVWAYNKSDPKMKGCKIERPLFMYLGPIKTISAVVLVNSFS